NRRKQTHGDARTTPTRQPSPEPANYTGGLLLWLVISLSIAGRSAAANVGWRALHVCENHVHTRPPDFVLPRLTRLQTVGSLRFVGQTMKRPLLHHFHATKHETTMRS
ncbi:unnamed protein product, partial [Ectocarpus sp. 13 AM-2016]